MRLIRCVARKLVGHNPHEYFSANSVADKRVRCANGLVANYIWLGGYSRKERVMGFAVKRADGTYRCWNRNSQDDTLRSGETWEELNEPPAITAPPPTAAETDAQALREAAHRAVKATVVWALRRLLGRNPTAGEIRTAREEWIGVWKALS